MGIIIRYMTAKELDEEIEKLNNDISVSADSCEVRNRAQTLLLLIDSNEKLSLPDRNRLTDKLRILIRGLFSDDFFSGVDTVEVSSLLEQLCIAADFYLLPESKQIRLYPTDKPLNASLNLRAFENCFFRLCRSALRESNELSVEIKESEKFIGVNIRSGFSPFALPKNSLILYENGEQCICLKLKKSKGTTNRAEEDFSLLLADRMSPLRMWLCDLGEKQ